MKFLPVLLLSLLMGCAVDSDDTDNNSEQTAVGIWQGKISSGSATEDMSGMVASNGKAYFHTEGGVLTFGTVSVSGNDFSYNGTGYASGVSPYSMTMSGSVITDNSINVSYTTPSQSGTISFAKADASLGVYDRSSNLNKLEGTWNDDESDILGTWVFTVEDTGSFLALRADDNCTMDGQFNNIDTDKNEFSVSITIKFCGVSNGNYSGLAFTSDEASLTDNVINLTFENGQIAVEFRAIKQ